MWYIYVRVSYINVNRCLQLQGYSFEVERKKVPLLFVFCKPDVFISSKLNFEHAAMYGILEQNTDVYGSDGQLTQKGTHIMHITVT